MLKDTLRAVIFITSITLPLMSMDSPGSVGFDASGEESDASRSGSSMPPAETNVSPRSSVDSPTPDGLRDAWQALQDDFTNPQGAVLRDDDLIESAETFAGMLEKKQGLGSASLVLIAKFREELASFKMAEEREMAHIARLLLELAPVLDELRGNVGAPVSPSSQVDSDVSSDNESEASTEIEFESLIEDINKLSAKKRLSKVDHEALTEIADKVIIWMCKFDFPDDPNYEKVIARLRRGVAALKTPKKSPKLLLAALNQALEYFPAEESESESDTESQDEGVKAPTATVATGVPVIQQARPGYGFAVYATTTVITLALTALIKQYMEYLG